jgi:N-acetylneuraminate lyase
MPPTFIKPANLNALVGLIAEAAAASPALPVYYYHISCMTGVDFNMEALLTAIDAKGIPNFRGIKFTDYKINEFMGCIRNFEGRYDMLYGRDEQLLPSLVAGAKGAVGSTYNYMAEHYVELMKHFKAGNIEKAQECQHRALKVIALLGQQTRYGTSSVDVGKAILELRGVPVGPPRLPRAPMTAEGKALLRSDLEKLNFNLADVGEPAAKKAKQS